MRRNKRSALAYRETFLAGRIGIRRKILIYLMILAAFVISMVWLFQNALLFYVYRGPEFLRGGPAPVIVITEEEAARRAEQGTPDNLPAQTDENRNVNTVRLQIHFPNLQ